MNRLLASIALSLPLLMPAVPARAQSAERSAALPEVDANGEMRPLRPEDLTRPERSRFERLDGEDAVRYLYTRGYLRFCREVVQGRRQPLELPPLPARRNWNRAYLSEEEARDVLDVALGLKHIARTRQQQGPRPA